MRFNSAEPWLSKPSWVNVKHVNGFIDFLERSMNQTINRNERKEIEAKLGQLHAWRAIATELLKPAMKKGTRNFVDKLELPTEMPYLFMGMIEGTAEPVNILTSLAAESVQRVAFNSTRSCDDFESKVDSEYMGASSETVLLRKGYIFEKCLRKVDSGNEKREIYTGVECTVTELMGTKKVEIAPNAGHVVIKKVAKVLENEALTDHLRREFKSQLVLTQLRHANINELIAYYEDDDFMYSVSKSAGSCDLMDLLSSFVTKMKRGMPERLVKELLKGAANGLSVAHNLGIAHRDVSLENLVLDETVEESLDGVKKVQVIDWGHSTAVAVDELFGCKYDGPIGKMRYMSPELILLQKEQEQGIKVEYNALAADVFAFGVCLFSMLVGQMPFEVVLDKRGIILREGAHALLARLKITSLSTAATDLLERCLAWQPENRPTMAEVLSHPFFKLEREI